MKKLLVILFIGFSSCSSKPNVKESLNDIGINLKDNYSILNNNSSIAFGESSNSFDLKISKQDFKQIVAEFKLVKNYAEFKENDFPNSFSVESSNDKVIAFKSGTKYFYNVTKAKTNENYEVILIENNKLSFIYSE